MVPVSELEDRYRVFNLVSPLSSLGMVPVNELLCKLNDVSELRPLSIVGILPLRESPCKLKNFSELKVLNHVGIVPLKLDKNSDSDCSAVMDLIWVERVPPTFANTRFRPCSNGSPVGGSAIDPDSDKYRSVVDINGSVPTRLLGKLLL